MATGEKIYTNILHTWKNSRQFSTLSTLPYLLKLNIVLWLHRHQWNSSATALFSKDLQKSPNKARNIPVFIAAYLQYAATLFCMLPWKSWEIPWHFFSDDTDRIANKLGTNWIIDELGIFCALSSVSDPPSKMQIPTSFAGSQKNDFRGFYTLLSTFNQDFSHLVNDPSLAFCFWAA